MLTETAIRGALAALDRELGRRGVKGEICLFGGAVMVLAFHARQSTKDVDAIFAPTGIIRELADIVGRERGWESGWLNDGVKGWLSSRKDVADAGLNLPYLTVLMPVPEYLLAMKCMAARVESQSRDLEDVKCLVRHLGLQDAAAVLAVVEAYYPRGLIPVKTQYFVETAFEEMAAEAGTVSPPPDVGTGDTPR